MRKGVLISIAASLVFAGSIVAIAQKAGTSTAAPAETSAEVKVGSGIEKMEITGESSDFKVATGTKIYAWTKVTGAADSKITIAFCQGEKQVSKQELSVPRSPYRTNAYRTFRTGDAGEWAVKVLSADGKELGKATFKVEIAS